VVAVFDSSNSTEADRQIIYINGVRQTSFATNNPLSSNEASSINDGYVLKIGKGNSGEYFNGLMSHVHFIDGQAYAPTVFGETDTTTGEWKIKAQVTATYGTNGFFILKDGNSVTDQSGRGNNFVVAGGTLTKSEDNPANNFATWSGLNNLGTLSLGSTRVNTNNNFQFGATSSLGVDTGKYYWEVKAESNYLYIGVDYNPDQSNFANNPILAHSWQYKGDGTVYNNGSGATYGNTYTTNNIIGVALDLDNSKLYFRKDTDWQNSGDPTSGSTGTGAISITSNKTYFASVGDTGSSVSAQSVVNFGNGYFGTTQVATAGTNASGNGIFEYDVPTGYTALSTKGINS